MKAARLILLALTSLPLLNSCQGTEELKGITVDNRIGIEVGSGIFTKSGKTTSSENLFSIPFVTDSGETMYINAVLSDYDMNPVFLQGGPLTKGAAVTTSNIGSLPGYETFNMSVYHKGAIYKSHEDEMKNLQVRKTGMGESSRWELPGTYFWPTGYDMLTPLFFCAWAPAAAFTPESEVPYAGSVSDLSWTCDVEGRAKATFSYTLPASATDGEDESGSVYQDAANQPDLVFAVNPQTSKDHVIDGKSYAQITFGHALTAVRFVRGTLRNCILNRIALEGFHSSGDCEYSYDSATEGYQFKWTGLGELKSYTQTFDRTVDNSIKSTSDEGMGDYFDPTDQSSYTFMMIPQELDQTAVIKIYLDGRLHPIELLSLIHI